MADFVTTRLRVGFRRASTLTEMAPGGWSAAPLAGDGSERRFFRVWRGGERFVACVSAPSGGREAAEAISYLRIWRHLKESRVPVPELVFGDAAEGFFLFADAGDVHLDAYAQWHPGSLDAAYRRVLRLLLSFHSRARRGFHEGLCFDTPLYDAAFVRERECEYFRREFLSRHCGIEAKDAALDAEFADIAETAGAEDRRFVIHRDFQSRNIMVRGGRLLLLDWQGMRFGPPAYDLASLLLDPYAALPDWLQERLERLYAIAAERALGIPRADFLDSYSFCRLARNLQVLGAYGYLAHARGKPAFLAFIPRALESLSRWLAGPLNGYYPALSHYVEDAWRYIEEQGR